MDKVKNFCDHSMILWEMTGDLPPVLLGLRVIFDQWPKLHLGLDALSNKKILKGV